MSSPEEGFGQGVWEPGEGRESFSEADTPREMLVSMWIDKAEPWEGLGIEKETWEPAACKSQSKVSTRDSLVN